MLPDVWEGRRKSRAIAKEQHNALENSKRASENAINRLILDTTPRFRISATSNSMIVHSASVPRVQQQSRKVDQKFKTRPTSKVRSGFKLGGDLLFYLMDFLDYPSIVFLKLTCKKLNSEISLHHLTPTFDEQLTVLNNFYSNKILNGERFPPHLCKECMMWHTFECVVIWPSPRPESAFRDSYEFKYQTPRKCIRHALKTGEWQLGKAIDEKHTLCSSCQTPKSNDTGKCSWNCHVCGCCTGRDKWSEHCFRYSCTQRRSYQEESPKPQMSDDEMGHLAAKRKQREKQADGLDVMICGSCCNYLFQVPGVPSKDVCRCGQASSSFKGQYTTWPVSRSKESNDKHPSEDKGTSTSKDHSLERGVIKDSDEAIIWDEASKTASNKVDDRKSTKSEANSTLVKPDLAKTGICNRCPSAQDFIPGSRGAEICACKNLPPSSAKQELPQSTTQETRQPTKDEQNIVPAQRFSRFLYEGRKVCRSCSRFAEITPGVTLMSEMCRCPGGPLPLSQKPTAPLIPSTPNQPISSKSHPVPTDSKPITKEYCSDCHLFTYHNPGSTPYSKMCRCPGGPNSSKTTATPPSNRGSWGTWSTPTCPHCRLYDGNDPKVKPMAGRCQCKKVTPIPSSTTSVGRQRCPTCSRFSNITPGVTMVSEMCYCLGGPLTIKRPVMPTSPSVSGTTSNSWRNSSTDRKWGFN